MKKNDILTGPWSFAISLSAIVLLAILLAVSARWNNSLTIDEPFTANVVNHTFPQMLTIMWDDVQQPLYYLLLRPWRVLFGESEIALRTPTILFFCGAIIFTGLAGKKWFGNYSGLLAAALVALSSITLNFAVTARPYMLVGFLVSVYCWIALNWIMIRKDDQPLITFQDGLFILLLGLIGGIGLLSHIIFIFALAAFSISAIFLSWRFVFRFGLASIIAIALFLLFWGAYFFHGLSLPSLNAYYQIPGLATLIDGFLNFFGQKKGLLLLAGIIFLVIVQPRNVVTFFKDRGNQFLALIPILSLALPVIVSQFKPIFVAERTPIISVPVAALVLAGLLGLIKQRWITISIILVISFASLYYSTQQLISPPSLPFKQQVAAVLDNSECGDMVISVGITEGEVAYYLRQLQASDCLIHESFPAVIQDKPWTLDLITLADENRLELEDEAVALAQKFEENGANKIWVFAPEQSSSAALTEILREQAEPSLRLVETTPGWGSFNDILLLYEVKN